MLIKKNSNRVCLKSFVLFEKCSKKSFIYNSEKYLNSIGIAIYIWRERNLSIQGMTVTYVPVTNNDSLNSLIEIFGLDNLVEFYKTIMSNENLRHLPHCQYNIRGKRKSALLNPIDKNSQYSKHTISYDIEDSNQFLLYCMTRRIMKSAGYKAI